MEERAKLVFLRGLVSRRLGQSRGYAGVVYGVAVGLGFATVEAAGSNVVALFNDQLLPTAFARGLHATAGHAARRVLMGFCAGRAAIAQDTNVRGRWFVAALLLPAIVHGIYDFLVALAASAAGASADHPSSTAQLAGR